MTRLLANRVAKEVVHEALKQYPSAIPWFIGIYDDWTIGHFKHDPGTNHVTFRSENFSERNLYNICYFISKQIEKELHFDFISHYANFNNEPGRLVVKQLVEAVTDLMMDKPIKRVNFYDYRRSDEPQRLINGIPEDLWYIKHVSSDLSESDG